MEDSPLTPDQEAYIKKMISKSNEFRLETRDQLPLGVMAYGFNQIQLADYLDGASLPADVDFTLAHGKNTWLFTAGSAFHNVGSATIGLDVFIDGTLVSQTVVFTNESASHKALIPRWVPLDLTPGDHTATLQALTGTSVDGNDVFVATIFEFPG